MALDTYTPYKIIYNILNQEGAIFSKSDGEVL